MSALNQLLAASNASNLLSDIDKNMSFLLMNKDRPIYKFKFTTDESIQMLDVYEKPPFWITDLQDWLAARGVAKRRSDVKAILSKNNALTLFGFTLFTRCISLNDTLWVKQENDKVSWSEVSPYTNKFEDTLGVTMTNVEFGSTHPTLSTDGEFPKCWKKRGDSQFLIKEGRTGYEPFAETFASRLKVPNANIVKYNVEQGKYISCSVCECFTSEKVSFLPYLSTGNGLSLEDTSRYYDSIGCIDKFNDMLLLDAVSVNTDRHSRNFGIIINSDTYDVISMAPLFDMNYSYGFTSLSSINMPIEEYIQNKESRRFGDFIEALSGRCTYDSIQLMEESVRLLEVNGIEFCEEQLLERMINISKYQLDKIKKSYIN